MTIKTILATMQPGVNPAAQLDAALRVAQCMEAEIEGLYVRPNPAAELAFVAGPFPPSNLSYDVLEQAGRQGTSRAHKVWNAWLDAHPGGANRMHLADREGLLEAIPERQGRLADLIVLHHPAARLPETERAFDAAVFSTGRPCLVVRDGGTKHLLAHAVFTWNGSL